MWTGDRPMMLAEAVPGQAPRAPHLSCGAPLGPWKPHLPHVLTTKAKKRSTQPTLPALIDLGFCLWVPHKDSCPRVCLLFSKMLRAWPPETLGSPG